MALIQDHATYINALSINKTLKQAIIDGDIGSSTGAIGVVDYDNTDTAIPASDSNKLILIDSTSGAVNLDLPSAVGNTGKIFYLKMAAGTNLITISTISGQQLDIYGTSIELEVIGDYISLISNGANWFLISNNRHDLYQIKVQSGISAAGFTTTASFALELGKNYEIQAVVRTQELNTTDNRKRVFWYLAESTTAITNTWFTNFRVSTVTATRESYATMSDIIHYSPIINGQIRINFQLVENCTCVAEIKVREIRSKTFYTTSKW